MNPKPGPCDRVFKWAVRICVPMFVAIFRATCSSVVSLCLPDQVTAVYTWWNLLESLCPPTKSVLRLNLDETAVKTWMAPGKGLIAPGSGDGVRPVRQVSKATRKQQRSCLTHVAFLCDNPEIQPYLPHVIIGNEGVLPVYIQKEMAPKLFRNVFLVRRKSAWVDGSYMALIITLLGEMLKPFLDAWQPILLMDALPAHLAPRVFRAAARNSIHVVVVPARLTWLIQPADTHAFFRYKMYLRKRYMEAMARSPDGELQLREVLLAMNDGVRYVFQAHDWSKAFHENGFSPAQLLVREAVLQAAGMQRPLSTPAALPTYAQLRSIWPARLEPPLDDVFASLFSPPQITTARTAQQGAQRARRDAVQPGVEDELWSERLRPRRSGSFVFPSVYSLDGDSPDHDISGSDSAARPRVAAAPPAVYAHASRRPRRVARPIAASRPSAITCARRPAARRVS